MRRDLSIRLLLMYHQSWFIFAESGFARSGPGLKCLKLSFLKCTIQNPLRAFRFSFLLIAYCLLPTAYLFVQRFKEFLYPGWIVYYDISKKKRCQGQKEDNQVK